MLSQWRIHVANSTHCPGLTALDGDVEMVMGVCIGGMKFLVMRDVYWNEGLWLTDGAVSNWNSPAVPSYPVNSPSRF